MMVLIFIIVLRDHRYLRRGREIRFYRAVMVTSNNRPQPGSAYGEELKIEDLWMSPGSVIFIVVFL